MLKRACAVAAIVVITAGLGCRRNASESEVPADARAKSPSRSATEGAPATYDGTSSPAVREAARERRGERAATRDAEPKPAAKDRPPQTIYRSEIERALSGGPGHLLYQLGPEPFRAEGKFLGWEITKLFPDDPSLCDPCDLEVGDVILTINGDRLETPQAFATMVEKADKLRTLEVRSLRDEQRRIVKYTIVDD